MLDRIREQSYLALALFFVVLLADDRDLVGYILHSVVLHRPRVQRKLVNVQELAGSECVLCDRAVLVEYPMVKLLAVISGFVSLAHIILLLKIR